MSIHLKNGYTIYTIEADDAIARMSFVPEKGGVASSLILSPNHQPQELLFLEKDFWTNHPQDLLGGLPFLFPICGRLERNHIANIYSYRKNFYQLPIHGFAPYIPWQVKSFNKNNIVLSLLWDCYTFAVYPFKFALELSYTIHANGFICHQKYSNLSDDPLPYYAGFHPYFLTPFPNQGKETVMLHFSGINAWNYNDKLTDINGSQTLFSVPMAITQSQINEKLISIVPGSAISLKYPNQFTIQLQSSGSNSLTMFNYLQLYTVAEKPFFCIEPWMSFPNAMNTIDGVRWLGAHSTEEGILQLTVHPDEL